MFSYGAQRCNIVVNITRHDKLLEVVYYRVRISVGPVVVCSSDGFAELGAGIT